MHRSLLLLLLILLTTGCASPDLKDPHEMVVFVQPVTDPPRFVTLTDADHENESLRRLVAESKRAEGRNATYVTTIQDAGLMMETLSSRWREKYGGLPGGRVVVRYGPWFYEVATAV